LKAFRLASAAGVVKDSLMTCETCEGSGSESLETIES
jgi:hypothetical protein